MADYLLEETQWQADESRLSQSVEKTEPVDDDKRRELIKQEA